MKHKLKNKNKRKTKKVYSQATCLPNLMIILRYSRGLRPSILRFESKAVSINFFSFTVNLHVFANLPSIVFYGFSNSTIKLTPTHPPQKKKKTLQVVSQVPDLQGKTNEAKAKESQDTTRQEKWVLQMHTES